MTNDGVNETVAGTANGYYDTAYGGFSLTTVGTHNIGTIGHRGTANGNTLTIDGKVTWAHGGFADEQANGNTVTINGTVTHALGGAIQSNNYGSPTQVERNTVTVTDTGEVTDGAIGGRNFNGAATGNRVFINGGSTGIAIGGEASGDATGNKVFINDGTVDFVLGGEGGDSSAYSATSNTVTLAGGTVAGDVRGGDCERGSSLCDRVSGNTLAVQTTQLQAGFVANFENLAFTLPTGITKDSTMLRVGEAFLGSASSTNISIFVAGTLGLAQNDTIKIIEATSQLSITSPKLDDTTSQYFTSAWNR